MKSASDVGLSDERKKVLVGTLHVKSSDLSKSLLESAIFYTFQVSISFAKVNIDERFMLDGSHFEVSICLDGCRR